MQTPPPALPFVSRLRRDIKMGVQTCFFKFISGLFWIAPKAGSGVFEFTASKANKYQFDFFFKSGRICQIFSTNTATAEYAYM